MRVLQPNLAIVKAIGVGVIVSFNQTNKKFFIVLKPHDISFTGIEPNFRAHNSVPPTVLANQISFIEIVVKAGYAGQQH